MSKRRLYDITNVLEGVGLLTRLRQNVVCWSCEELSVLRDLNEKAATETRELEMCLMDMLDEPSLKERLYVVPDDIDGLVREDQRLFVVEANRSMELEVVGDQLKISCCVPMIVSVRRAADYSPNRKCCHHVNRESGVHHSRAWTSASRRLGVHDCQAIWAFIVAKPSVHKRHAHHLASQACLLHLLAALLLSSCSLHTVLSPVQPAQHGMRC